MFCLQSAPFNHAIFLVAFLFLGSLQIPAGAAENTSPPVSIHMPKPINIWYGEKQRFGSPGLTQRWVNIPGRVNYHDQVASLNFSLNGGPEQKLHIGPDSRRLAAPGDFNVEIDANELRTGSNDLRITRILKNNNRDEQHVKLHYQVQSWPLPYTVDWSKMDTIQDAVQVVDGFWQLTGSGIRTTPDKIGYDRTLAIGDAAWSSYEILVPFTVNAIDPSAYASPSSVSPGLGLILHWNGHTDTPVDCGQPHCGWFPVGAIHWYTFPENGPSGLNINTRPITDLSVALPYELEIGTTYLMRSRVEVLPFQTLYYLKVWRKGEEEPTKWSLQQAADRKNPDFGGVLIIAHHVDLTIGNIEAKPVNKGKDILIKEYLILLPLILTIAAGLLFLFLFRGKRKNGRRNAFCIVAFSLAAIALCTYLEPFLPGVLQKYHLNARMTAALYIGFEFSFSLFQAMIWITILLSVFRKDQREANK
jgi:hypothetical protein